MTAYVVLKASNESSTSFDIFSEQEAASTTAAVNAAAEEPGVYLAIPRRSFTPLKVELAEVQPRFKVMPLTGAAEE